MNMNISGANYTKIRNKTIFIWSDSILTKPEMRNIIFSPHDSIFLELCQPSISIIYKQDTLFQDQANCIQLQFEIKKKKTGSLLTPIYKRGKFSVSGKGYLTIFTGKDTSYYFELYPKAILCDFNSFGHVSYFGFETANAIKKKVEKQIIADILQIIKNKLKENKEQAFALIE